MNGKQKENAGKKKVSIQVKLMGTLIPIVVLAIVGIVFVIQQTTPWWASPLTSCPEIPFTPWPPLW